MSTRCILVTPKRKLAGHLAVMKNVLHFFGEFLVEGTGGASTFKNFEALKFSDLTKLDQKQKALRWSFYLQLDSRKGTSVDNVEVMNDDGSLKRPLKNVKRHRRWYIGKVGKSQIPFRFIRHCMYRNLISFSSCSCLHG